MTPRQVAIAYLRATYRAKTEKADTEINYALDGIMSLVKGFKK